MGLLGNAAVSSNNNVKGPAIVITDPTTVEDFHKRKAIKMDSQQVRPLTQVSFSLFLNEEAKCRANSSHPASQVMLKSRVNFGAVGKKLSS